MSDADPPNIVELAMRMGDPVAARIALALYAFDAKQGMDWPARRLAWALCLGVRERDIDDALVTMRRHGLLRDLQ